MARKNKYFGKFFEKCLTSMKFDDIMIDIKKEIKTRPLDDKMEGLDKEKS